MFRVKPKDTVDLFSLRLHIELHNVVNLRHMCKKALTLASLALEKHLFPSYGVSISLCQLLAVSL